MHPASSQILRGTPYAASAAKDTLTVPLRTATDRPAKISSALEEPDCVGETSDRRLDMIQWQSLAALEAERGLLRCLHYSPSIGIRTIPKVTGNARK